MLLLAVGLLSLFYSTSVFAAEVCYPPYGCFHDNQPYAEALVQLPWSPKDLDTKFMFYTRKDLSQPTGYIEELDPRGASKVGFHPNKTTVFLTHGYIENRKRWWVDMFIKELLNNEDMNLIFVEWAIGSAFPYHQAVGNARLVGAQVSHLIELIRNDTGINWPRMRIIGFSLGGHVMGYAGRNLRRKGLLVPRISVLDPASPYFENEHVDLRIDPTDAVFVDAIHTDSKTLRVHGFGAIQEMGHIDFYPNGGSSQVGCENFDISVVQYMACSHYRVLRYYIESINSPCPYYGYPCKNFKEFKLGLCSYCPEEGCPKMGYHVTQPKKKLDGMKYYSKTHKAYPFCARHYTISFHTGSGFLNDLDGKVTIELYGSKGSEEVDLTEKYYNAGSIERTIFILQTDVGDIQQIRVKHNRIIDIWYLEAVTVRMMSSSSQYVACFNRWLNHRDNLMDMHIANDASGCKGF